MCSYEKWASLPRWDLTWFCRDLTKVRKKFPYEHAQVGQPRQGGIEFCHNLFATALHHCLNCLKTYKRLKTAGSIQSFSRNITNFLIKVRQKIPYERGIKKTHLT